MYTAPIIGNFLFTGCLMNFHNARTYITLKLKPIKNSIIKILRDKSDIFSISMAPTLVQDCDSVCIVSQLMC